MKIVYNKNGVKNGYVPADFSKPSEWDNEYSEEDEVFVQSPNSDKSSATKPLMCPRAARATTKFGRNTTFRKCRSIISAVCCFIFLVLSLGSLMGLVIFYVNKHNKQLPNTVQSTTSQPTKVNKFVKEKVEIDYSDVIGCDHISIQDVWTEGIPKLLTESAFRSVDVNQDGILDIILGFATGADGYNIPKIVCDIYFGGTYPCFGGLIAFEGATGKELWRHYSDHELYGINCAVDLNKDDVVDCFAGGRAGAFQAVSGKDGSLLWNFGKQDAKNDIMNLYTPQVISDLDGDGVSDILVIHGGDPLQEPGSPHRLSGRILIMSGRTGKVISWTGVPDGRESYYSPQVYSWPDGTQFVLFGTGGETHGGSLWLIKLEEVIRGNINKARALYTDKYKGVMTPPVLVDLTGDGIEDIVIPVFNSTVLALDGYNFEQIWNWTLPMSESYNTPAPGYYNDDNVPDFLIKYAHGPGFPVYYHSVTTVLDGRTGRPLIEPPIRDTVGAQASGLTVSMEGRGNDIFLYWAADCTEHTGEGGQFQFVKGTNVHEQSRSDFCRLRFKTKGYSKIYAISRHIPPPGVTVYYSEDRTQLEHGSWINTTEEGYKYVMSHSGYLDEYRKYSAMDITDQINADGTNIIPHEEGSEILFDTPVFGHADSSTYKKSPSSDVYKQPLGDNILDDRYSESDYDIPYDVNDQYPSYQQGRGKPKSSNEYKDSFSNMYGSNQRSPYFRGVIQRNWQNGRSEKRKPYSISRNKYPTKTYNNSGRTMRTINTFSKRNHNESKKSPNIVQDTYKILKRRHVGPHDEDGLQRLLSTGSLMPTSLPKDHPNFNNSIDFVFATYWFFPAKTKAILPEDQKCIEKKLSEENIRFSPDSRYYGLDHDSYEHTITDECLTLSSHILPDGGTYESQTQYNPFNIHMGQMTVYRLRLTCTCSNITSHQTSGKRCARILPFNEQQWYGYMGNNANSHYRPRFAN